MTNERKDVMAGRREGFTLIELLVVIAIIGIIAALFIPQVMDSIQKSKQKSTMKDVNSIATALTDFVTDNGTAPVGVSGAAVAGGPLYTAISGFYLKVVPQNDLWGTPFNVWCGSVADGQYSGVTQCGLDDFLISSFARDRLQTAIAFNPAMPTTCYFDITDMNSFNEDLVNWSGSWIHVPRSAQYGATT
jgi:general secretion pathway protein G